MGARLAKVQRLGRQFWARRREFGEPAFWAKAARIGTRLAETALWPEELTRSFVRVFEERPWNLHVETTNACNADCVFCAYQFMERRKKVMKLDVYRKVLADYVAMGGGDLHLQVVVGDPVLDPTFLEKIHLARKHPEIADIHTITNGIGLDRIGAAEVVESGLTRIFISTAGFDRESYAATYRTNKYDKMRGNVLDLLRENEIAGRPLEITIGFRTHRPLEQVLNDRDFQEIRRYDPKIDFTYSFDDWGGKIDFSQLPAGYVKREPPAQTEACKWLYDGPIVFTNGDVGLCGCRDIEAASQLVVGNVLKDSLLDIWRSESVRKVREGFHGDGKPDICRSCTMYRSLDDIRSVEGFRKAHLTRSRWRHSSLCHAPAATPTGGRRLPVVGG